MKRSKKYQDAIQYQDQEIPDFLKPYSNMLKKPKYKEDEEDEPDVIDEEEIEKNKKEMEEIQVYYWLMQNE